MKLKNKKGKLLILNKLSTIKEKIKTLKELQLINSTKEIHNIFNSLIASETFSTLFIEGHILSRRLIRKTFSINTVNSRDINVGIINNFKQAYIYSSKPKKFSVSNLFTLYSLISEDSIDKDSKLNDGDMYRQEDVFISSNQLGGEFKGFNPNDIHDALNDLCAYLNDSEEDIYLKAVIGHFYFELIHPYYDFNGRTGRFIPMWLFANSNKLEDMMYFSTAIGNYKDQYLALFNKYINHRTLEVDLDRIVIGFIDLLILNQRQYIWIKKLELKYLNKTNKSFSIIQKDFIWKLMIKIQISHSENGWYRMDKVDKNYIELDLTSQLFSNETRKLEKFNIIKISNDLNRKYKLLNYKLF